MNAKAKGNLLYWSYFTFMIVLALLFFRFALHIKVTLFQSFEEFEISNSNKGVITLTDESLQKMEEVHSNTSIYLVDLSTSKDEITHLYDEVVNAPVCSIANRHFNSLEDCFYSYEQDVSLMKEPFRLYEEQYVQCLDLISQIPEYSHKREERYNELVNNFGKDYETICEKKETYLEEEKELRALYLDAKQIADEHFDRDYDLMCHIVNAEGGNTGFMERCYIANTLENREKDPRFPNTLYEVIYAPGQYEPVMSGTITKNPSSSVKQDVEEYLRGRVETGMPDNVVYQSLFTQGKGIWKKMPSGHYFCY